MPHPEKLRLYVMLLGIAAVVIAVLRAALG
jgi:hypothetical protein